MIGVLRRVRAYSGHFALLAALVVIAGLLLTAAPRLANRLSDDDLRSDLAGLPWSARDLVYRTVSNDATPGIDLDRLQEALPPQLRRLVTNRWYAEHGAGQLVPAGREFGGQIVFDLGMVTGAREAVRVVNGRWPKPRSEVDDPIEIAVPVTAATTELGMGVGSRWRMTPSVGGGLAPADPLDLVVVGVYEPVDPNSEIWKPWPLLLEPLPPLSDSDPWDVAALTDDPIASLANSGWPVELTWRFHLEPQLLTADQVQPTLQALLEVGRTAPQGLTVITGLDNHLQAFADGLRTVRALVAIVLSGVVATLVGLIALAAWFIGDRRRDEFRLLRARGGSHRAVAARSLSESLLVVPPGALLGWALGNLAPGRPPDTGWLVVLVAACALLAPPVAALLTRSTSVSRQDLVTARPSLPRRTAEATLLALAALAVFLLRRRGLSEDGTVDPLLVSAPPLLAAAAGVVALRAYPWPLRLVSRLAARARGVVGFLGTARASRATVSTVPVLVLVVAIATAAFCGVVVRGVADARDRAAAHAIPADALLIAESFAVDTADELARLPGVRAVASVTRQRVPWLSKPDGARLGEEPVTVLVVDGPALARVVAESGAQVNLPSVVTSAADQSAPVPALVSPDVALDVPDTAQVAVQEQWYEFRAAAVVDSFPTLEQDIRRFVVLPQQALPADRLVPNGFLVAAADVDVSALREVGDRGQRRWLESLPVPREPKQGSDVRLRADYRAELERGGHSGLLWFVLVTGGVGGLILGMLAVGFAVVAGASSRGRMLSRLRTMGLSLRQWRLLLACELAPLIGAAVLTGAAVGVCLPILLAPVLKLSRITSEMPVLVRFDPGVAGAVVLLGVLALGTALVVETMTNRRLRLGEVLRLGEES